MGDEEDLQTLSDTVSDIPSKISEVPEGYANDKDFTQGFLASHDIVEAKRKKTITAYNTFEALAIAKCVSMPQPKGSLKDIIEMVEGSETRDQARRTRSGENN